MAQVYVDTDSGTFGLVEGNLVVIELESDEIEFFGELSDSDRSAVAKMLGADRDADFDVWSAHAAVEAQRLSCIACGGNPADCDCGGEGS